MSAPVPPHPLHCYTDEFVNRQMTGALCHVCSLINVTIAILFISFILETMSTQRASSLLAMLPAALQTGYLEVVPGFERLKVQ